MTGALIAGAYIALGLIIAAGIEKAEARRGNDTRPLFMSDYDEAES